MPTAAFTKVNSFVQDVGRKVHNLHTDTFKIALTNSAPSAANTVLANITQITVANGYASGGNTITGTAFAQVGGVASFVGDDTPFTAAGGTMATFRYAVIYNDSATNKELVGFYDYGTGVSLGDTEALMVDFPSALFTVQ